MKKSISVTKPIAMRKLPTMNFRVTRGVLKRWLCGGVICLGLLGPMGGMADAAPHQLLEKTVQSLLDEFTSQRTLLEQDKQKLFQLVERMVVPLFDFGKISKLVLASHWRQASEPQRQEFSTQFKNLLIRTYATALFKYTGNEKVAFIGSDITERQGRKFATVKSEVTLGDAPPITVDYALLLGVEGDWKIYNLTINGLNLVSNYRNTYAAAINQLGMEGMLESMQQSSTKQL